MTDIEREIVARIATLKLVDGLPHDAAEARAISEVAAETKTQATARPKPTLLATAARVSAQVREDARWVLARLLGGPYRVVMPRRAYAPPDAPPSGAPPDDVPLPRKRLRRQPVPTATPEPAAQPPAFSAGPLLYVSGTTDSAQNIADEFERDARFRDRATANWRADQERDWR